MPRLFESGQRAKFSLDGARGVFDHQGVTERFGFTNDEWDLLTEVPLEIYLAMLGVDVAVNSFDEEEVAFGAWLEKCAGQCPKGSWMQGAFRAAAKPTVAQAHGATSMSETELRAHLREVCEVLRRRVGETDAVQFSELLVKLAERVASASAGLGPGSGRISKAEGDLIWRMRESLGLIRTLHP